ncbi:DsbC family protein [Roseateles sp. MS654]|uniref:DsbC family protein n=1 Tax=Roseateles sp. MS654 TaxID=3412685 RepID=UPI003C2AC81F
MNLTEARIAKFPTLDFAALPLQDAIVTVRGRGARKFAVFADAECAFCKQLEGVLQERDDITVYTFLMPILGPGSVDKAKAIWCAQDRSGAWGGWHTAHGPAGRPPRCSWSASWRRWRSEPNGNLRSHSVMRRRRSRDVLRRRKNYDRRARMRIDLREGEFHLERPISH